jgi:uncharacterized protein (TIGR02231 family)
MTQLEAPIVAVAVYPAQARVTRRGRVEVGPGAQTVTLEGLPASLVDESVRVRGRGGARITGVDVARRHHPLAPDATIEDLEGRLRDLRGEQLRLADDDDALGTRMTFLEETARRGGREIARALASGAADADRVAAFGETLREQLGEVSARRRAVAVEQEDVARQVAAVEAELHDRRRQRSTERRAVEIGVESESGPTAVELEVSYVVAGAGWHPVYDARLDAGGGVTVDWYGLVTQYTGEDWPAGELTLSTARPALRATIPELDPWYVDILRFRPLPRPAVADRMMVASSREMAAELEATLADAMRVEDVELAGPEEAVAEQGATAVSYRLPRPVEVPSDGSPHRAMITSVDLTAVLDYVAVPKLAEEAYLRAKVTNTSPHTLLPGDVSIFHGDEFVGTTSIEPVPPGAELELHLGVDDRVKVERKLTRRDTGKAMLSGSRRTSVTYTITIENRLTDAAKVTVVDQFPVSKHEDVKVRDTEARPDPKERTELDVVTWEIDVPAGAKQELTLAFTLEHPKNEHLTGWTD